MKYYKFIMRIIMVVLAIEIIVMAFYISSNYSLISCIVYILIELDLGNPVFLLEFVDYFLVPFLVISFLSNIIYSLYVRFCKKDVADAKILFYYPFLILVQIILIFTLINLKTCAQVFTDGRFENGISCYPTWYQRYLEEVQYRTEFMSQSYKQI